MERTTRFTMLLHLPRMDRHGDQLRAHSGPALAGRARRGGRDAIAASIATLPSSCRSLTWDQGAEMAEDAQLRIETGLAISFCDPNSPWQRGTNENTNGLLRQYFPKGTDLSRHSAGDLAAVAAGLDQLLYPATKPVLRRPLEPGQYLWIRLTERLAGAGVQPSMGSVGDSFDKALAENLFSILKVERVYRTSYRTREEAELDLFRSIDGWYNSTASSVSLAG